MGLDILRLGPIGQSVFLSVNLIELGSSGVMRLDIWRVGPGIYILELGRQ